MNDSPQVFLGERVLCLHRSFRLVMEMNRPRIAPLTTVMDEDGPKDLLITTFEPIDLIL